MSNFLQLITLLVIILLAAKIAGYLSTRVGQPSVFGELLIGVILGPSLLNFTGLPFVTDTHINEIITEFGEIGVMLLMFLADWNSILKTWPGTPGCLHWRVCWGWSFP
jgi:Kef-type K+ transport system membrane component KefB